jgi:hypothetical protein
MNKWRIRNMLGSLAIITVILTVQVNMQFEKLVESIEFSNALWADMWADRDKALADVESLSDPYSKQAIDSFIADNRQIDNKYSESFVSMRESTGQISLLPWNLSHRRLKTAFLRHLDARVSGLNRAKDEILWTPEFKDTWEDFCTEARRSSPILSFGRHGTRLAIICAKGIGY